MIWYLCDFLPSWLPMTSMANSTWYGVSGSILPCPLWKGRPTRCVKQHISSLYVSGFSKWIVWLSHQNSSRLSSSISTSPAVCPELKRSSSGYIEICFSYLYPLCWQADTRGFKHLTGCFTVCRLVRCISRISRSIFVSSTGSWSVSTIVEPCRPPSQPFELLVFFSCRESTAPFPACRGFPCALGGLW